MLRISTIGLDLAKTVFQVHCIDDAGDVVVAKPLRRAGRCWRSLANLNHA